MKKYLTSTVIVLALVVGGVIFYQKSDGTVATDVIYCQIDSDCVVGNQFQPGSSCCSVCNQEAVNTKEAIRRQQNQKQCFANKGYVETCGDVDCEPSTVTSKCINNKCKLVDKL